MERRFNLDFLDKNPEKTRKLLKEFTYQEELDPKTGEIKEDLFYDILRRVENRFSVSSWEELYLYEQHIFGTKELFDELFENIDILDYLEDKPGFYEKYWKDTCGDLEKYVKNNNLKSLVLGISGGLDSSVCAAIAWEVARRTGIKNIGISLPIVNSVGEISSADLTGKAWYSPENYITIPLEDAYKATREVLVRAEEQNPGMGEQTKIADGNIMARLRMISLYNFAGVNKGIVLGTGNLTENLLGFFTIHGDEPMDYSLLDTLYKTEVYRLAEWIRDNVAETEEQKKALQAAIDITPTDGLGISSSDLEQIGAESYYQVDRILQHDREFMSIDLDDIPKDVIDKVRTRVNNSKFKQRFVLDNLYQE